MKNVVNKNIQHDEIIQTNQAFNQDMAPDDIIIQGLRNLSEIWKELKISLPKNLYVVNRSTLIFNFLIMLSHPLSAVFFSIGPGWDKKDLRGISSWT